MFKKINLDHIIHRMIFYENIVQEKLRFRVFTTIGVSGATIKFDKFGDSEGNFSVLALKKDPFHFNNFSCDFQMKPVGQFQQGETLVSELFTAFVQLISIHMCSRDNTSTIVTINRQKLEDGFELSKYQGYRSCTGVQAIGGDGLAG